MALFRPIVAALSLAALATLAQAQPVHAVLDELASRLPSETRVDRIAVAGGTVQVQGQATDVEAVLAALGASALFDDVKRSIPDANDLATGMRQFILDARLASAAATATPSPTTASETARERVERVLDEHTVDACLRLGSWSRAASAPDQPVRVRIRCRESALSRVIAALETGDAPLALERFQAWRQYGLYRAEDGAHVHFHDVQFDARSNAGRAAARLD